jgi:RNA polymerase sigma-70 factor (ECF subfamily)
MDEPDPVAIRAAASGDVAAFEGLVRDYQTMVWRYLRHFLGDPDLALDVTQETFVRVFRRLDSFRHQSKFSTWLLQIARNAGIDAIRGRDRRARLLTEVPPSSPSADPVTGAELEAALAVLDASRREPLLLVEVTGLTYREAAVVLGIPEGTVKSRVHSARRELLAWWRADDDGPATGEVAYGR